MLGVALESAGNGYRAACTPSGRSSEARAAFTVRSRSAPSRVDRFVPAPSVAGGGDERVEPRPLDTHRLDRPVACRLLEPDLGAWAELAEAGRSAAMTTATTG